MSDSTSPSAEDDTLVRLERALARMSPVDREVFLAHRLDELSYREIAERTGLSIKQVERAMARVIYRLHQELTRPPQPRRWPL